MLLALLNYHRRTTTFIGKYMYTFFYTIFKRNWVDFICQVVEHIKYIYHGFFTTRMIRRTRLQLDMVSLKEILIQYEQPINLTVD